MNSTTVYPQGTLNNSLQVGTPINGVTPDDIEEGNPILTRECSSNTHIQTGVTREIGINSRRDNIKQQEHCVWYTLILLSIILFCATLFISATMTYFDTPFVNIPCQAAKDRCTNDNCFTTIQQECQTVDCVVAANIKCKQEQNCTQVDLYCTPSVDKFEYNKWKQTNELSYREKIIRTITGGDLYDNNDENHEENYKPTFLLWFIWLFGSCGLMMLGCKITNKDNN